jgi:polysaccharide export outer membrane protein
MKVGLMQVGLAVLLSVAPASVSFCQEKQDPKPKPADKAPELAPGTSQTKLEMDTARSAAAGGVTGGTITGAPVDPRTFVLGPEDVIYVSVWREPDFTRSVQLRPDGKFTLPLIGELTGVGLTPDQVAEQIKEALTKFINKPEVSVSVQQVLSKKYYITGEVNRTGVFPLVTPITILEALVNAGGFHEYAKTKKIWIMRGKDRIYFNYNDVIRGKHLEQNIQVQNGDYIHIP